MAATFYALFCVHYLPFVWLICITFSVPVSTFAALLSKLLLDAMLLPCVYLTRCELESGSDFDVNE